jgi:hypothetical protein
MRQINLRYLLFLPLMLIFANLRAQDKSAMPSAEERATKMTDWMKSTLQLNDTQLSQVQAINLKYANKRQEMMNNAQGKKDKDAWKADEAAKDAELKGVLTDDQYKTYQTKKEEMKKEMKEKMKEKKASGK